MTTTNLPATTGGPDDGEPYYRPFADIIKEVGRGALHADLSKAVAEVTASVIERDKAGTVTLTLKIEPVKDSGIALTVSGTVTSKRPAAPASSLFYGDEDGLLTRNDPRQATADFDPDDQRMIERNTRR